MDRPSIFGANYSSFLAHVVIVWLASIAAAHAGEEFVPNNYFVTCGLSTIAVPDIDIAALRVGSDGTECFAAVGGASQLTSSDLRGLIAFSTDDVMSSLIEQDLNFLISPKSARLVSQLGPLFAAAARDDLEANELIALFDDLSFQRDALDYDALARCATERSIISVSSNLGDEFSELKRPAITLRHIRRV